jgi:hypothetical protein
MSKEKELANEHLTFKQGQDNLFNELDSVEDGLEKIRSKLSDLTNIKNLHFLMGAGASSDAIPTMAQLIEIVQNRIDSANTESELAAPPYGLLHADLKARFQSVKTISPNNLENILGTLYSKRAYLKGVGEKDKLNKYLIQLIESEIYTSININPWTYTNSFTRNFHYETKI